MKGDKKDVRFAGFSWRQIVSDVHVVRQNLEQEQEETKQLANRG
ncbi:hypothetical protein AAA799E16_01451 [Marine Group I thaumarchaeote SCGC AAA799-E16]|uniref:Uncharacterized protein n=4 Tax=Marine Group I TaxID=905826 RepID=A0A081RNR7_9ARCH|nr:hypothetical protein AAA799N04_00674 [Marine Group I thaumarchaeote SCGC AAA799-N04]KER05885.1 hypothetical protein AAA799E16_01451 [Marine Group I thaumarchaeote SCGC AAA799-E16]KFM15200.1 hypothetical protein AAA799D11_01376 [Marine Group I thaumarchaeote SCGC AAA799-D11]KFM16479.1 hypothetical protein SCCGRSA3_02263 [Marine Group I thaumarchaeote SCGC RSA3]